jgi:hypothetical protein
MIATIENEEKLIEAVREEISKENNILTGFW